MNKANSCIAGSVEFKEVPKILNSKRYFTNKRSTEYEFADHKAIKNYIGAAGSQQRHTSRRSGPAVNFLNHS